jgi:putative endonuclease
MGDYKKKIGEKGEQLALKILRNKGYKILEKNWRFQKKEIDIIAQDGDLIVFVEVKTRQLSEYVEPDFAVGKRKQSLLIKAADAYLVNNNLDNEARFDIVSIVIFPGGTEAEHIIDAFYPMA